VLLNSCQPPFGIARCPYVDPLSMTNRPALVELSFDLYSIAAIEMSGFLGSQHQSLRPTSSLDLLLTLN
jgi:hypothetical protein